MVPNNVQLVQETALVDGNRGSDPQEIYKNLKLELSSQPCAKLRKQIVKEFIRSNPNVRNMKDLREQIGYFAVSSLYKWRSEIHIPARNNSLHADPSCMLSHARQQPQPHELAIDGPHFIGGEYSRIVGYTGQYQNINPVGAAWSNAAASSVPGSAPFKAALLYPVS
jgi:hypothetical protein